MRNPFFPHFGTAEPGRKQTTMPNTGRLYAPAAAAAFRERYMRPYTMPSSVPSPHSASMVSARVTAQQQFARGGFRRPEDETYVDTCARGRPTAAFDRSTNSDDRECNTITYPDKLQRSWDSREQHLMNTESYSSPPSFKPLSSGLRPSEDIECPTLNASAHLHDLRNRPSTLPRLSVLLSRAVGSVDVDAGAQLGRKRPRDISPSRDESMYSSKHSRLYESADAVFQLHNRSVLASTDSSHMLSDPLTTFATLSARLQPLPTLHSSRSTPAHEPPVLKPSRSMQESREEFRRPSARHLSSNDTNAGMTTAYNETYAGLAPRSSHQAPSLRHAHASEESARTERAKLARGLSASSDRNSEFGGDPCVIEAAADLVEERSPSKRESITKLLLKSKEFVKAKSLVRNRNDEIDWVATFLNVGFESNSIYSLMCPLRKGRWKVEEEKYTLELLRLIENGTIRLRHGQSIRGFIAKKLHSDDMRVLKKLSNCKMFHFARLINPRMSDEQEADETSPNASSNLERLEKLKAEFLRSVQLEALVAVRKYLSDTSIRDLLNARA